MKKHLKTQKSQHLLIQLAKFLNRHTVLVLVLFACLTAFFTFFALKLEQETSVRDLLPEDNQVVRNFEETVTDFDLIDRVVVVLRFDPKNLELAQSYADIFVEQVDAHADSKQYLVWLKANLFNQAEAGNWHRYLQFITRLMPKEQLEALKQRLSVEGVDQRIAENRRELESGLTAKVLIEKDPLYLLEFAGTYRNEIAGNYQINFNDGYLVSKDKDMLLILGKPTQSPQDVDFSTALTQFLKDRIQDGNRAFQEEEEADPAMFQVGLTGPHPITAEENAIIQGDVIDMFISSFVMVLLLFVIAYRRPLAIFYVGIPLLCAELWTLGIGYFLFGRLNLLTAAFSAVIVGLGIDYAIHIFSRYLDERIKGLDAEEAMAVSLSETGLGTLVGGLTTALAFLAMGISNFSGLREFAAIAAVGILCCLLQMFVLQPCMLFWRESWREKKNRTIQLRAQWDFRLDALLSVCLKHDKITAAVLIITTVVMAWQAAGLRFNTDIRSVRAKSNPAIMLQNKVTQKVGGSLRSLTFVLKADSEKKLYEIHDHLIPVLSELKNKGELVRYDSLLVVLQNPAAQHENMKMLTDAGLSGEKLEAAFARAMDAHDMRITPDSRKYIHNLGLGLDAAEPVSLAAILETENNFVRPFLHHENGVFKTLIHVYPATGLWKKDEVSNLTDTIMAAVPDADRDHAFVTGIQSISDELKRLVRNSFEYSTIASLFLVTFILWFHFRRFSLLALTLTPLLVAVTWMLGTMHLLGIDITILNFVATPIIIGIGIDDGVHIVEKYLHRGSEPIEKLIASCGKAVTLTSLTTVFGFSSLFLADYSGFHGLGICAILGVAFCWLHSVILLPILMKLFDVKFARAKVEAA